SCSSRRATIIGSRATRRRWRSRRRGSQALRKEPQSSRKDGPDRTPVKRFDERKNEMTETLSPVLGEATVQELREATRAEIFTPADDEFDEASRVWNSVHDTRRPAVIVRPSGPADVIAAVGFARSNDLQIAVRGGGHSIAGFSTVDAGIVIDLGRMRSVRVDPDARRAYVGGGATWGDVD